MAIFFGVKASGTEWIKAGMDLELPGLTSLLVLAV